MEDQIKSDPYDPELIEQDELILKDVRISTKRKSENFLESEERSTQNKSVEISPSSNASSSNLASGREKRIRKQKAYDDDYVMYDSASSLSTSYTSQPVTTVKSPTMTQSVTNEIKFNVSDIVWAKISSHPWWPCMISNPKLSNTTNSRNYTEDKNDQTHIKYVGEKNRPKRMYYVEFFGPANEHAWVFESCLHEYKGVDEFKTFAQEQVNQTGSKTIKEKYQFKISLSKRENWELAVKEADLLLNKRNRDRKLFFIKKHSNTNTVINKNTKANVQQENNTETVIEKDKNLKKNEEKIEEKKPNLNEIETKKLEKSAEKIPKRPLFVKFPFKKSPILNQAEEGLLKFIKNRLTALTLLEDKNIIDIVQISNRYQINENLLIKDYFGFGQEDELEIVINDELKSNFFNKIEQIKTELNRIQNEERDESLKNIPIALVSLKYEFPMIFVNRIFNSLNQEDLTKSLDDHSFNQDLYNLNLKLIENSKDINKLYQILNESESNDLNLKSINKEIKQEDRVLENEANN